MTTTINDVNITKGTAATPSNPNDNSTNLPNTEWVQNLLAQNLSLLGNGYYKFTNGLILQWGTGQYSPPGGGGPYTQGFAIAFPNACFVVVLAAQQISGFDTSIFQVVNGTVSNSQFQWSAAAGSSFNGPGYPYWIALGY